MMDLVDFGPLHILMRDDNSRISIQIRDLSVDSDQLFLRITRGSSHEEHSEQ